MTKINCADSQPDFIVSEVPFAMCLVYDTSPYVLCSLHLPQQLIINSVDLLFLGVATASSLLGADTIHYFHNYLVL